MKNINSTVSELGKLLNAVNSDHRVAAYHATAIALVKNWSNNSVDFESGDFSIKLEKSISSLNEIAVLDRDLLKGAIISAINESTRCKVKPSSVYAAQDFESYLGFYNYYSKDTVDTINKNFSYFTQTLTAAHTAFTSYYSLIFSN